MVAFSCSMYIFLFCLFYLSKTLIVIYLFKLLRLLHDRIDPTVELLKKKPSTLKRKRAQSSQSRYNTSNVPPIGAPSWCLNQEALNRFNRSDDNTVYDYDTDDNQNNSDNNTEDENNGQEIPKRKKKKNKKQKRNKKNKSK